MRHRDIMMVCEVANKTMDDDLLGHIAAFKQVEDPDMAACALHLAVERAKELTYASELPDNVIYVDFVAKRRVA